MPVPCAIPAAAAIKREAGITHPMRRYTQTKRSESTAKRQIAFITVIFAVPPKVLGLPAMARVTRKRQNAPHSESVKKIPDAVNTVFVPLG